MSANRVRPAIDLMDGRVVRLEEGRFDRQTVYAEDPLETAQAMEAAGLKYLHVVDLDGAKARTPKQLHVLETLAKHTGLRIDYGGGIATTEAAQAVLDAGAAQVNIGSVAAKQPALFRRWLSDFGPEKFVLCADCRDSRVVVNGWQTTTDHSVVAFIQEYVATGVQDVLVTDISRDGMLNGPSLGLYMLLLKAIPSLRLVASGGVRDITDLKSLARIGVQDVVVGRAIYEGRLTLAELVAWQNGTSD